jgi:sulfur-oxidizing protein SoxY
VSPHSPHSPRRRTLLLSAAALPLSVVVSRIAYAQLPDELASAVRQYTGGKPVQAGRVKFEIASIVENGNSVPVTVSVDSPMTASDHVKSIAIFNEKNPQRDVVVTRLGPRAGRARMSTRIRLATSQKLVAVAETADGNFWAQPVDVIVALAACIE